jgi:AcrR family transcriptional regulator
MVGRPREFDTRQAIADARDALWANGVHATSVKDLSEATRLSTGSIYKAFGSKDGFVHAVLDDYLEDQRAAVEELAASDDPLEAIRELLEWIVTLASDPSPQRGCLAANCSVELSESDPVAMERIRVHGETMHRLLSGLVRDAAAAGQVPSLRRSPDEVAGVVWLTIYGLQIQARRGISVDEAADLMDASAQLLLGVPLRT